MDALQRAIELRENGERPYSEIAAILTREFGEPFTKDGVQKMVKRYWTEHSVSVNKRKVVVLGDLHAAPHHELTEMIIDEQPDVIVVGGDLLDSRSLNSHGKPEAQANFKAEISICRFYLTELLERTGARIYLIKGNHEDRIDRILSKILPPDVLESIEEVINPLALVTTGLERTHIVRPHVSSEYITESEYWMMFGDAFISHMNFTAKNPGASVKKLYDWCKEWRKQLGLPEISLYIQTHTHKMSYSEVEGGHAVLVEPGVAGDPRLMENYKVQYDGKWSAGPVGAVVFEQEEGRAWTTRLSSVRLLRPQR